MKGMGVLCGTFLMTLALAAPVSGQERAQVATGPEFTWVTPVKDKCGFSVHDLGGGEGFASTRVDFRCDKEFSDPRVSGTYEISYWLDCYGDQGLPCIAWQSQSVENAEGGWTGWANVLMDPDETEHWLEVMTGSGAYEGLTFVRTGLGHDETTGLPNVVGLIYEGNPPPTVYTPSPSAAPAASD